MSQVQRSVTKGVKLRLGKPCLNWGTRQQEWPCLSLPFSLL